MSLGNNIKRLRVENNLTQKDLANELYVTPQAVSRWETDESDPDIKTLQSIAKLFNVTVDILISDDLSQELYSAQAQTAVAELPAVTCQQCGNTIEDNNKHIIERVIDGTTVKENIIVCDECYNKQVSIGQKNIKDEQDRQEDEVMQNQMRIHKNNGKVWFWSIFFGGVALIISLIVFIVCNLFGDVLLTIFVSIAIGYAIVATIYCLFSDCYIQEIFMELFPGGLGALGILLPLPLAILLSIFSFPFIALSNN